MVKKGAGIKNRKRSLIKQHKQIGKKLIPPLMQNDLQLVSWMNDRLPEMLWACLVISVFPRPQALNIFSHIAELGRYYRDKHEEVKNWDLTHSSLTELPDDVFSDIVKIITFHPDGYIALRPLLLIDSLPGRERWHSVLATKSQPSVDWSTLINVIGKTLDYRSQETTDVCWLRIMFQMALGRMKVFPGVVETMNRVVNYTSLRELEMQEIGSVIRATEGAFDALINGEIAQNDECSWSNLFWGECLKKSDCMPIKRMAKSKVYDKKVIFADIVGVRNNLLSRFLETLETTDIDAKHDVIFGFGFYSLTLLRELLTSRAEQGIIGRLVIKSMVDFRITLSYLLAKDNAELWQKFREYGVGQAKLNLLKFCEASGDKPSFLSETTLERLANEDMSEDFVSVDLGHWCGLDLRTMAQASGTKDDYDKYYGWSSTYSHGHWSAITDACFATCFNPLHRLHRIPLLGHRIIEDALSDVIFLVNKILSSIGEAYPTFTDKIKAPGLDRLGRLINRIDEYVS